LTDSRSGTPRRVLLALAALGWPIAVFTAGVSVMVVGAQPSIPTATGAVSSAGPSAPVPAEPEDSSQQLAGLATAKKPADGYRRDAFGPAWQDTDHNGCDSRNDILGRDLTSVVYKPGTHDCVVLSGILDDPYTGATIPFQRGNLTSEAVQIDHVVPLGWAWDYGAADWSDAKRLLFANDPMNLLAVDGESNQSKSDSGPSHWLPPNRSYRCDYARRFVEVLFTYRLAVPPADRRTLQGILKRC